jgi:TRAP-type C4-dicarboxylate transport system permease small subunit
MELKHIPEIVENQLRVPKNALLVLAAGTMFLMMLLTTVDVVMRYVINSPIPGALEIVEYMMVIIVPFALVVTAYDKAHIEVEIIVERLPATIQCYLGFITDLTACLFFMIITWQSFQYIGEQFDTGLTSSVLLIPQYPFILSLTVAFTILSLITLVQFLKNLTLLIDKWIR